METSNKYDAIVLGAGPAGLTAGIYLSRAKLRTLIISEGMVGGQMILTHEIANYPGVESISGYQLSGIMRKQAKSFGCDIISNTQIVDIKLDGSEKMVSLIGGKTFFAHAVILSPGGRSRTLGVAGEEEFKGRGISYCATCDGGFFAGKEIVVVGGGNSALEEAVSLTKYATKVTVVHQFDHFQAFEHAIEEVEANPKISTILESTIEEYFGNEKLEGVVIRNLKTGAKTRYRTDGAFVFIGYVPNTEFLADTVSLNSKGEIVVDADMQTSIAGVFAAGDSTAKRYRQITTAVADGTIAALSAAAYVNDVKRNWQKGNDAIAQS
jgi:thioredoxin reductase (NADPH)